MFNSLDISTYDKLLFSSVKEKRGESSVQVLLLFTFQNGYGDYYGSDDYSGGNYVNVGA